MNEVMPAVAQKLTKTALAQRLMVSRSSLYYQRKRPKLDEEVKLQIQAVLADHPSYGHKRIALELKLNKKRILRVMKLFGIKPYRRRTNTPKKPGDVGKPPAGHENHIKTFCPMQPDIVWVSDFTYIRFEEKFIYLATVMDLYTREVVGWNILRFHNQELVLGALTDALVRTKTAPVYLHSDQGSEYESIQYLQKAQTNHITISMSKKSSPWENAYQESFYSGFKVDLGRTDQFADLSHLIEAIHQQIHYYNTNRIHTTLKASPQMFRRLYEQTKNQHTHDRLSV